MNRQLAERRADLLRKQIVGCRNCSLHLFCTAPVPPFVPPPIVTPELLIIGEGPGHAEDKEGEPFLGPAGKLLWKWLKMELGLTKAQCMVGNAVQCRPTTANHGRVNRAPSNAEIQSCSDNRARILQFYVQRGGKWMLLLGATALKSFLPDARITRWAGRPFVLEQPDGSGLVWCMSTFHPGAALHDPNHIATIRRHLNYLMVLRKGEGWPEKCVCGKDVAVYDGMGVPWCGEHRVLRRERVFVPVVRSKQGTLVG